MSRPPHYLSAEEIDQLPERESQHQFNANAVRLSRTLSEAAGMSRLGVHIVRLTSGRDSTQYHYHDNDEEFLYVLSGHGEARIGDHVIEVGPGDFMGFPCGSAAHSLHNPHEEDLVYLMAGEGNANDMVHYPDIRKSLVKSAGQRVAANWEDLEPQAPKKG